MTDEVRITNCYCGSPARIVLLHEGYAGFCSAHPRPMRGTFHGPTAETIAEAASKWEAMMMTRRHFPNVPTAEEEA